MKMRLEVLLKIKELAEKLKKTIFQAVEAACTVTRKQD